MLNCGDTFLAGDEDDENLHLRIIITPPVEGEIVTVAIVTAHKRSERLVVLNVGDHEFITHESVIAYKHSAIKVVADIEAAISAGLAKPREPVSPTLLKKAQDGLRESEFTPNGVLHYFKSVMGL